MSVYESDLFGSQTKVEKSIEILKSFEPEEGYILAYSGGKDSVCIKALADMSGVKYHAVYNNTTVDPPELVKFIRSQVDVEFLNPEKNMRELIIQNGPPTRLMRHCCKYLKERSYPGRLTITGVRWAESVNRKKNQGVANIFLGNKSQKIVLNNENDESRRVVEQCYRTNKTIVNPIINWSDEDVWEFIHKEKLDYCNLYDDGYKRLGCIGCPMGNKQRITDFERYPRYRNYYVKAFQAWLDKRRKNSGEDFRKGWNGEDLFNWWIGVDSTNEEYGLFEEDLT